MSVKNAATLPKVYYGLHFAPGVAEYRDPSINNGEPYCILLKEDTIKKMDKTFQGKPVYVGHVDKVDLDNLQVEAAGYVIDSFYNPNDGKHWAKFIIVSDAGHSAISKGWRLSNAYHPTQVTGGGLWHGVSYKDEVTDGEYEHLAIVPDPRYSESVILTPEQYKTYNEQKGSELLKIANSASKPETKGAVKGMFEFFKRSKIENSAELESTLVTLPRSKKEVLISTLVNEADSAEMKKEEPRVANEEDMVKVGDDTVTVGDLLAKHKELQDSLDDLKAQLESKKEEEKSPAVEEKKENEEEKSEEVEKKENAEEDDEDLAASAKKQNSFEALKNAHLAGRANAVIEISRDKVARGISRYGSGR